MRLSSRIQAKERLRQMQSVLYLLGGGIAVLLGFVGLLNFVNILSASIVRRKVEFAILDTVDNSQINVLTQRTMHRICTAATNEEVSFAYRVAIPRQRFRWRNAFSTRWRSL